MKLVDLLLIAAAVSLVAAGWLVDPSAALVALSGALVGAWWLYGEADA